MQTRRIAGLRAGLCACLILTIGGTAHAQASSVSAPTSTEALISDANTVIGEMDAGRYADLWDQAAGFVKARSSADEFIALLRHAHDQVGQVRRDPGSVVHVRYKGSQGAPGGLYANVSFIGTRADGSTVFEKFSFRFEDDRQWHLTGYVPRDAKGHAL